MRRLGDLAGERLLEGIGAAAAGGGRDACGCGDEHKMHDGEFVGGVVVVGGVGFGRCWIERDGMQKKSGFRVHGPDRMR